MSDQILKLIGMGGDGFDPNSPEQQKKSPYQRQMDERNAAAMAAEQAKKPKSAGKNFLDTIGGKP